MGKRKVGFNGFQSIVVLLAVVGPHIIPTLIYVIVRFFFVHGKTSIHKLEKNMFCISIGPVSPLVTKAAAGGTAQAPWQRAAASHRLA